MQTIQYKDILNWSTRHLTGHSIQYRQHYPLVRLGDVIVRSLDKVKIQDDEEYVRLTVRTNNGGIEQRDSQMGINIGRKIQYRVAGGQLLVSKIDLRSGAVGIVPQKLSGAVVTENFWIYDTVDAKRILLDYIALTISTDKFKFLAQENSNGSTGRLYMQEKVFLDQLIPLPDVTMQRSLIAKYKKIIQRCEDMKRQMVESTQEINTRLFGMLGLCVSQETLQAGRLYMFNSQNLREWSFDKFKSDAVWVTSLYSKVHIGDHPEMFYAVQRGVSPKYSKEGGSDVINQKCVRWYDLDMTFVKQVTPASLSRIPHDSFTQVGDLLVNSTGDGTLGRSAVIRKRNEVGKMYDSHVLLMRVNRDLVDSEYICFLFNSQYVQTQIEHLKSAVATSQTELGVENLKRVDVILPPVEIQRQISAELSQYRSRIPKQETIDNLRERAKKEFEQAIIHD